MSSYSFAFLLYFCTFSYSYQRGHHQIEQIKGLKLSFESIQHGMTLFALILISNKPRKIYLLYDIVVPCQFYVCKMLWNCL